MNTQHRLAQYLLRTVIVALFTILFTPIMFAQPLCEDFSFFRNQQIPVLQNGDTLRLPWAGGLNSARFFEIDLDMDGTDDLLVFEKHGNRLLTFLHTGNTWTYAPQFVQYLPDLHDWLVVKDFNNDGRPDIFTYGIAGIRVFKNVSDSHLDFQLVTDQLQAYYYNGYVNIYASPDDNLIVEDVDGDGRVDVLNFWVLGKYVHFLKNFSEDPETFDFRLASECWGHFEESADNNIITLFSDCDNKMIPEEAPDRHTGSSMLLHDFTGDGLYDLLLGDVDYPNLILLHNGGTAHEARMVAQDTAFPEPVPVRLYSMPAASLLYQQGQSYPTLLVSPSDPSLTKCQDRNSVWRYEYDAQLQQYTLIQTDYLQGQMLDVGSGARPVLFDWNQDGLLDLFVANYGQFDSAQVVSGFLSSSFSSSISYYENVGTPTQPVFALKDEDFGRLRALNYQALHPTFGDFDGDGLLDMLCGVKDGSLLMVPHTRLVEGVSSVVEHWQTLDVGNFSTPCCYDLDGDGRDDLVIGNQRGLLSYYHNVGTSGAPEYERMTDTLGAVDVRNAAESYFGYSVPCLFRNATHGTILLCGSEQGRIYYYNNIDDNLTGTFVLADVLWESADGQCQYCATPIREGRRAAAAIADLDNDGFPDLLVGNYAGGLAFFSGRVPTSHGAPVAETAHAPRIYPNPTSGLVHIELEQVPLTSVTVYDVYGRTVFAGKDSTVNMSFLPSGVYLLSVNDTWRAKVVRK